MMPSSFRLPLIRGSLSRFYDARRLCNLDARFQSNQPLNSTEGTLPSLLLDAQPLKSCRIYELAIKTQVFHAVGSLDAESPNEVFELLSSRDHSEKPRNR